MALDFDQTELELDKGILDGTDLQMETIEDTFEKAIARYDYPYADGADLEDMGQKAHTIRFKCYFWDDAEQQSYDTHLDLLDSLEVKELLDFVHPKYGLLKGKIESIVVLHDDSIRKAVLDISFVEQMRGAISVTPAESVLSSVEDAYQTAQEQQEATLAAAIKAVIPAADYGAVSQILDAGEGLLAQMESYSETTRAFVAQVEKYISTAEAVVSQIESPIDSIQATIAYSLTLPGRILGAISGAVEKVARLFDSLADYPSQFISKLDTASADLDSAFADIAVAAQSDGSLAAAAVMPELLTIAFAQRMALETAALYAADNDAANVSNSSAGGNSVSGGNPDFQVMNIRELESSLAVVRTRIEAAVEISREIDSLKKMAVALLTHVNSVRLQREKMIAVTLDNSMPLHLVCLRYGLPYTYAERLISVNSIKHPNFTDGEVLVYVR